MVTRAAWRVSPSSPTTAEPCPLSLRAAVWCPPAPQPLLAATHCHSRGRLSHRISILPTDHAPITSLSPYLLPDPRGCLILMSPSCSFQEHCADSGCHSSRPTTEAGFWFRGVPTLPRPLVMIQPEFELICLRHKVLCEFSCVLGWPISHQL